MVHLTRENSLGDIGIVTVRNKSFGVGFYKFIRNSLSQFNGQYNPIASKTWLQIMEDTFKVIPCIEENKVSVPYVCIRKKKKMVEGS